MLYRYGYRANIGKLGLEEVIQYQVHCARNLCNLHIHTVVTNLHKRGYQSSNRCRSCLAVSLVVRLSTVSIAVTVLNMCDANLGRQYRAFVWFRQP